MKKDIAVQKKTQKQLSSAGEGRAVYDIYKDHKIDRL